MTVCEQLDDDLLEFISYHLPLPAVPAVGRASEDTGEPEIPESLFPRELPPDRPLLHVLDAAGTLEVTGRVAKKNYSERLSRELARFCADYLRPHYNIVTPRADGRDQEMGFKLGETSSKRLDVTAMTDDRVLQVAVSIKTICFADERTKRFTKNMTNREGDLHAEGVRVRRAAPEARLGALLFLPVESASDGNRSGQSSFTHAIATMAKLVSPDCFDGCYIGLFHHTENRGFARFAEAGSDGRTLYTIEEALERIRHA